MTLKKPEIVTQIFPIVPMKLSIYVCLKDVRIKAFSGNPCRHNFWCGGQSGYDAIKRSNHKRWVEVVE